MEESITFNNKMVVKTEEFTISQYLLKIII
nr:MAG TPA: hypothetical protein [Caudoviricetes sp.]